MGRIINYQLPITNYQLPITDYQLPITNYRLPITHYQLPITHYQIMDLLEYQAKELFNEIGIPILPSQSIDDPSELKRLQIPYPVVLKSQVRAGGRGRAGGVRFVENTIDAIAAARAIFNLKIMGEYPQVLLAEARYNAQQEIFLAVLLDYQLQRPVLLGSAQGGMDIETLLKNMHKVVIEEEFSLFYGRRLLIKMGLPGNLIQSVSAIVEKMYHLFLEKDLDLIEINPLGINADGEVMALDGKITINDYAFERHADLVLLTETKKRQAKQTDLELESSLVSTNRSKPRSLEGIDQTGNIGIISNSLGLALATWDLIAQDKGKLACCLIMQEETNGHFLPNTDIEEQLEMALDQAIAVPGIKVILVNILGSSEISETVAQAITDYLQPHLDQLSGQKGEERTTRATSAASSAQERRTRSLSSKQQSVILPQLVIRLVGLDFKPFKERLTSMSVYWTENIEQAVTQTITFAKSK